MPTLTRTFLKTAMGYLVAGMVFQALWFVGQQTSPSSLLAYIQPTALHLLVVGWLTQLIIGIAMWMFPPWSKVQPRGPAASSWLCYGLINGGLLLRLVIEPVNSYRPAVALGWLLVGSAVLQVLGVWLAVLLIWPRVRTKPVRS
ncbi:MAG: hypothetical protein NVS2B7_12510 [Herpetosiphon sp.]